MKLNDQDIPIEQRDRAFHALAEHGETLRKIQLESTDRAQRYLLFTNAGGAVATLSFMGAKPDLRDNPAAWGVLGAFAAGVVLCGFLAAVDYHTSSSNFRRWLKDAGDVATGVADTTLPGTNLDRAIGRTAWLADLLGWLAFAAFITGLGLTFYHLRPRYTPAPVAVQPMPWHGTK